MAFNIKETLDLFGNQVTYSTVGGTQRSYTTSGNLVFDLDGKSIKFEADEGNALGALYIGTTEWAIGTNYTTSNIGTGLISIFSGTNGTNWTALNITDKNVLWSYDNTIGSSSYSTVDDKFPLFLSTREVDLSSLGTKSNIVVAGMYDAKPDKDNALFLQEARLRSSLNLGLGTGDYLFLSDIDTNVTGHIGYLKENDLTTAAVYGTDAGTNKIIFVGAYDGYLTTGKVFTITGGPFAGSWTVVSSAFVPGAPGTTEVIVSETVGSTTSFPGGTGQIQTTTNDLIFATDFLNNQGSQLELADYSTKIGASDSTNNNFVQADFFFDPNAGGQKSIIDINAYSQGYSLVGLKAQDTSGYVSIDISTLSGIILADQVNSIGASYKADYSIAGIATVGDRWIPDAGWVSSQVGGARIQHFINSNKNILENDMYLVWGDFEIDSGITLNNDGRLVVVNGTFTNNGVYNQGVTGNLELINTDFGYILAQGNETLGYHPVWTDAFSVWNPGDSTTAIDLQADNVYVTKEWVNNEITTVSGSTSTAIAESTIKYFLGQDKTVPENDMYLVWGDFEIDTGVTLQNDGRLVIVNGNFVNNGTYSQGVTGSFELVSTDLAYILAEGDTTFGQHLFWTDPTNLWSAGDSTTAINAQADNAYVTKEWVTSSIASTDPELSQQTINATTTELLIGGSGGTRVSVPNNTVYGFEITVTAIQSGGGVGTIGDAWMHRYKGAIKNIGGTTAIIGTVTEETIAEDTGTTAWVAEILADDINDALTIEVTGEAIKIIEWIAKIKIVENSY